MTPERIEQLVNQALAFDAVSDPRGQIEMTVRQAIKEASAARAEAVATDETRNLILWNDTRIRQLLQKLPVRDLDELLARNSAFLATGNPLGGSDMNNGE